MLDEVNYRTTSPWPSLTERGGPSIVLKGTALDPVSNNSPANWMTSQAGIGGARNNIVTAVFNRLDTGSPGTAGVGIAALTAIRNEPSSVGHRTHTDKVDDMLEDAYRVRSGQATEWYFDSGKATSAVFASIQSRPPSAHSGGVVGFFTRHFEMIDAILAGHSREIGTKGVIPCADLQCL